ncbi:hypothetical protein WR25_08772 [Diploscapter pachys]|uniref:Uncharacterized protein n=1 Tax=Diploscapter pachys TaxID=2018661 RepID=A0A2A2JWQ3_9BILA|nr:hypothetical protein WR25_08772 [Diploscapter pachys]
MPVRHGNLAHAHDRGTPALNRPEPGQVNQSRSRFAEHIEAQVGRALARGEQTAQIVHRNAANVEGLLGGVAVIDADVLQVLVTATGIVQANHEGARADSGPEDEGFVLLDLRFDEVSAGPLTFLALNIATTAAQVGIAWGYLDIGGQFLFESLTGESTSARQVGAAGGQAEHANEHANKNSPPNECNPHRCPISRPDEFPSTLCPAPILGTCPQAWDQALACKNTKTATTSKASTAATTKLMK